MLGLSDWCARNESFVPHNGTSYYGALPVQQAHSTTPHEAASSGENTDGFHARKESINGNKETVKGKNTPSKGRLVP